MLKKTKDIPLQAIDLTPDKIQEAQEKDPETNKLLQFLETGLLPDNPREARALTVRQEDYIVLEGGIFFHIHTSLGPRKDTTSAQLVVPQDLKAGSQITS